MPQYIATPTTPDTNFTTNLASKTYRMRLRWNSRSKAWYLDVSTSDGTVIRKGAKLMATSALIVSKKELFPDGNLYVKRNIENYTDPVNRNNLGVEKEYSLVFITNEEINNG